MSTRSDMIARLDLMSERMGIAGENAREAKARMEEECAQRIRAVMMALDSLPGENIRRSRQIFAQVNEYMEYVLAQLQLVIDGYGNAMEKAKEAATMIVEAAGESGNENVRSAITYAALAQLAWAEASGNAVSAADLLRDAKSTVVQHQLAEEIRSAAAVMKASDDSHEDGLKAENAMNAAIDAYKKAI